MLWGFVINLICASMWHKMNKCKDVTSNLNCHANFNMRLKSVMVNYFIDPWGWSYIRSMDFLRQKGWCSSKSKPLDSFVIVDLGVNLLYFMEQHWWLHKKGQGQYPYEDSIPTLPPSPSLSSSCGVLFKKRVVCYT